MDIIVLWVKNNYHWFFSGLGVFILGIFFTTKAIRKKRVTKITTKGKYSPGQVFGDYNVKTDEKK